MATLELEVQGMTCGSCVKHVTQALQSVPGVNHVEVDLANGRARVEGDLPSGAVPLISALAGADYPAQLASSAALAKLPANAGSDTPKVSKGGCCCG